MATTAVTQALAEAEVEYELLPHRHTETAREEAEALGVLPEEVAKTLVLVGPEGYIRVVLPASERLDLRKVRHLFPEWARSLRLATEEELARDYAEFELGAVPPIGGRHEPVVVDRRLAACERLVFEAGSHEESIRLRTDDLLALADARLADLCRD